VQLGFRASGVGGELETRAAPRLVCQLAFGSDLHVGCGTGPRSIVASGRQAHP
jgi:hypothetical protein